MILLISATFSEWILGLSVPLPSIPFANRLLGVAEVGSVWKHVPTIAAVLTLGSLKQHSTSAIQYADLLAFSI
jgi:hypothetical protein